MPSRSPSLNGAASQVSGTCRPTCDRAVTRPPPASRPQAAIGPDAEGDRPRLVAISSRRSPSRRRAARRQPLPTLLWAHGLRRGAGGLPQQGQDRLREDAQQQHARHRQGERGVDERMAIDGRRVGLRIAHVHVDDHAQVVEGGQRGVQRDRHRQPAQVGVDRGQQHIQLGEEADGGRDAGQRRSSTAMAAAMAGAPGQAGEAVQAAVARRIVLQHAHHRERGQVHDPVAQDVEQDRLDAGLLPSGGGGAEQPARPGCSRCARCWSRPASASRWSGSGRHVADGHGQHGQHGDDRHPVRALQRQALGEEADQQGERAELGPDRQEAGDGVGAPGRRPASSSGTARPPP